MTLFYFTGGFMAQYDGAIRIATKITTKDAEESLASLEWQIKKSAKYMDELRSKMDALKDEKIPTKDYKDLQEKLSTAEKELKGLVAEQERYNEIGITSGGAWDALNEKIISASDNFDSIKAKIQELVNTGKDFTLGKDTTQYKTYEKQLQYEEEAVKKAAEHYKQLLQQTPEIQKQAEEEARLASIKENATVADQRLVDLLEQRRQLLAQIRDMEKAGVTEGYAEYDKALSDLSDVQAQINGIRDMRDAAAQARESYVGLGETVRKTFRTMARGLVDIPIAAVKAGVRGLISGFQQLGGVVKNVAVKSFHMLGNAIRTSLSRVGSLVSNVVSKMKLLGTTAKKSFSTVNKSAKKTGGLMSTIATRFKGIALSLLIFNWITKAFNGVVKSIKDGFSNLYKDNEKFKASVDNLRASILTLKNAFAAAFRPLVDVAIPYIQMAADKMTELLNKVGQFTAAITGQTTYTKAIKQTADAFKDAKKAAEGYLSPLDEINKFSSKKDEDEEQTGIMFEEVPIEQKFKDMAQKVKDIFKDLFAPIKEAWNREGEFVIDSWKYGLGEIKKLLKDIGRDFLKVWQQPATIAMLQDILHIFGDIGLIVGNLASKFREAWNANDVGLHILENIRDIFAVIISNIRAAADYTVEWTKTLDFTPLLQGIERLTASLVPFFYFLSGTLADFYTQFLLPLASWTLSEGGIPRLLNVLSDFMESVDWQGLREALSSLYSALEPYAEAVGTGLIDFIERMKEYGVDFLNFLPGAIKNAAYALRNGDLPAAFEEFGHICGEAVRTAFAFIKETIESINWGEIGTLIASFINGIDWNGVFESLFGSITTALNSAIDLIYNFITETDWKSIGAAFGTNLSNAWQSIDWEKLGQTVSEGIKSVFDFLLQTIDNIDWYEVGRKVGEFLSNIDWIEIINDALTLLFTLPQIIWDSLSGAIYAIDWGQLIIDIATALRDFFLNFDWMGFFESAGQYYGNVMKAIFDIVDAVIEIGKNIVEGLKQGIEDGFSGIAEWVKSHIFEPFIDGFKKAFDIHSPSKVMEGMGEYIIEGLLNGLKNMWSSVTSWIEDKVNWIIDKFRSVKEKVSGFFSGGGSGDSGQNYSSRSYSMRSMSAPYVHPAIAKLQNIEIPKLATGAVLPANREFLALVGDQKHGTNIEAPLDTIKQAAEEAVLNVFSRIGMSGGNIGGTPVNLTLQVALDGQVIGQKMVDWGKIQQMATGVNPYELGTT